MLLSALASSLFVLVGAVSLTMAVKNLRAKEFLPFHAGISGTQWEELDPGTQAVVTALMRVSGLGFLTVGILLVICPVLLLQFPGSVPVLLIPALGVVYCSGLAWYNYRLFKAAGRATPWKRSLAAAGMLLAGILLALLR